MTRIGGGGGPDGSYAHGDEYVSAQVPERIRIVIAKRPLPPVVDIAEAVRDAIDNPNGHEPISKLVGPKAKVTIAFDDASGSYFQTKRVDFRQVAIEIIVEKLRKSGVELMTSRCCVLKVYIAS